MITTKQDLKRELEAFVIDKIPTCLEDFKHFEDEGYQITAGKLNVNADFGTKILVDLEYPLEISKGPSKVNIDKISERIDLDFPKYLEVSKGIVESMKEKRGYICLSCLEELSEKYDMNISAYPIYDPSGFENDIVWFRLKEKKGKMLGGYIFALDFVVDYLEPIEIIPLVIEPIPDSNLTIGEAYSVKVKANKKIITFSDNTNLFDVSSDGMISFLSKDVDVGDHIIQIEAEDNEGSSDSVMFILSITK